jgi:urease accessory protein
VIRGPRSLELVARGTRRPAPAAAGRGEVLAAGRGEIQVAHHPNGRSVVTRAYATSPLRLLTPANHGHAAWIYASSYGGGLVDGDRVTVDVEVLAGAAALVSTQASTKVYRSLHGTETRLTARVDAGGLLVLAPDPVVCFGGARYRQVQQVALHDQAGLVLVDCVTSGRRAAGERWMFDEYHAHTEVRAGGVLALHDTVSLRAAHGDLAARFGRFDVLALVVLAGQTLAEQATAVLAGVAATPVMRRSDLLMSAAPLRVGGCAVRIAGRSVEQVGETVMRLLAFVPGLLGDDPWSRKW